MYRISFFVFTLIQLVKCQDDFELTILHTNDVHAHIEQFNKYGGTCTPDQAQKNECFGGVARRHTVVEEIRRTTNNSILIDGGDLFQGTLWFNVYKGLAGVVFMNYTKYDAMAIGNHEFDYGPQGLVYFMQKADFSIVCTNMNVSQEPIWPDPPLFTPSTVIERSGKKIGIIGYTTTDITWLSKPGKNIKFTDPVESIRAEARRLKSQGVNILIALGHAGFDVDQKIAREVVELDAVVGGHSNTFLWNGPQPSTDEPQGPYPVVVTRPGQPDGTACPVVQDFAYGKYLGNLKLTFDLNGKLKKWEGNPIMLNGSYPEDPDILKVVEKMSGPIIKARHDAIGRSLVILDGARSVCRTQDCNLGNFLTDALIAEATQTANEQQWATVVLAIWNGGGLRSGSIDKKYYENITREDLAAITPFGNTADILEIKGKYLIEAFNHGFTGLEETKGRFPQVSGFRLKYDKTKPRNNRLVEAKALCNKCRIPKYELIENEKIYTVITNDYMAGGGDGYDALKKYEKIIKGSDALIPLAAYLRKNSPVHPIEDGRIVEVSGQQKDCGSASSVLSINNLLLILGVLSIYLS